MASKTICTCDLCGMDISGSVTRISFETMVSPTIYGHAITPYNEICWDCKYKLLSEIKKAFKQCVDNILISQPLK